VSAAPGSGRPRMAPPPIVEEWVARWAGGSIEARGTELLASALTALREARSRPGRSRAAAEALLAADALLTYGVEDAAYAEDPDERLLELLLAIGREASS